MLEVILPSTSDVLWIHGNNPAGSFIRLQIVCTCGHLFALLGVTSPCSLWYMCTLGRVLIYRVLGASVNRVGEDTEECVDSPLSLSPSLSLSLSVVLVVRFLRNGISLSHYFMKHKVVTVTVRLIFTCLVFCRDYSYSMYTVNLFMLLWTCVWLWMLSTPIFIPRAYYSLLDTWQ